jgi:hypothetical protein
MTVSLGIPYSILLPLKKTLFQLLVKQVQGAAKQQSGVDYDHFQALNAGSEGKQPDNAYISITTVLHKEFA